MGNDRNLVGIWTSCIFVLLLDFSICKCRSVLLIKADSTTDDATATVPTIRLTTDIDTADGIMGITMYTTESSVVIKAVTVWIDSYPRNLQVLL